MPRRPFRLIAIVTALVILLDQVIKRVIEEWLGPSSTDHRWELAGRFLAFEYVENTGVAFGMFAGRVWLVSVLAIAVAALFVVLIPLLLDGNPMNQVAIGLILAGAAGNMIDRIRLGYVIDYIAIGAWPKFNVADSAITIGVVVVMLGLIREERAEVGTSESSFERSAASSPPGHEHHHERNDVAR